jgi:hypothetical protein
MTVKIVVPTFGSLLVSSGVEDVRVFVLAMRELPAGWVVFAEGMGT